MKKVPQSREEITLEWLQEAFRKYNFEILKFTWNGKVGVGLGNLSYLERLTLTISETDKNNNQEISELSIIMKSLPQNSDIRRFVVNEGFCQNEFRMYTKVFPAWQKFQDSRNTPAKNRFRCPTCYYAAEGGQGNDYKMILLLEDMFSSNFSLWPEGHKKGLRWRDAKPVVKQIALFHAVGMAYKEHNNIKCYSDEYPFLYTSSNDKTQLSSFLKNGIDATIKMLEKTEEEEVLSSNLTYPTVLQGLIKDIKGFEGQIDEIHGLQFPKEGRAGTICHYDIHINNIMMRSTDQDEDEAAILDFQGCCYSSPMNDLTFFLLLSCDPNLFTTDLSEVLQYYHEVFKEAIHSMDIDLEYSLEDMTEDYNSCVIVSVIHILLGSPQWCFGTNTNSDTVTRYRLALTDSYKRLGCCLNL